MDFQRKEFSIETLIVTRLKIVISSQKIIELWSRKSALKIKNILESVTAIGMIALV